MKKYVIAGLFVAGMTTAALAEDTKYFLVYDNQGLCSVLEGAPSAGKVAFGQDGGYGSEKEARDALAVARNDPEKCKGVIE